MNFDLAIIGAGWAGFSAAIYARENGLNVCLIEKDRIGGTCLNRGCIPTKAFVQSVKAISHLQKMDSLGIKSDGFKFDFQQAQKWKQTVVKRLSDGMKFRIKKSGLHCIEGKATITSPNSIEVGGEKLTAKFILIATGSKPLSLPRLKFDSEKVFFSDGVLEFKDVPRRLLIVGGGFIGCEFASIFCSFGSEVTVVELLDRLLPTQDSEASRRIEMTFKKRNIKVFTGTDVFSLNLNEFDKILVAVGRTSDTEGLFSDSLKIKKDKERIITDDYLRTSVENIYSAGDVSSSIQLAHLAAYEGRLAVYNMLNPANPKRKDYRAVPGCVFTEPEVASVGLTEEEAKRAGLSYTVKKSSFLANGMAHLINQTEGFIKILLAPDTKKILGATIVGPCASELITLLTCAISNNLDKDFIDNTIFAHPSLSELIQETIRS